MKLNISENNIVYRVQDKDGRGPFRPGFSKRWVESRPDHDNLLPWYFEFGPVHKKRLDHEHIGSGCETINQLRRWFTRSEYDQLLIYGYRAVRMEVGRILASSEIQCVFCRNEPLNNDVVQIDLYG